MPLRQPLSPAHVTALPPPQGLMALPPLANFTALLVLTLVTSTAYTPASILADAAVMAASSHVREACCRPNAMQRMMNCMTQQPAAGRPCRRAWPCG